MGKKGESQEGGRGDGYVDLMVAVVAQAVDDARNVTMPKRPMFRGQDRGHRKKCMEIQDACVKARYYVFSNEPESENYIFGFKSVLNHLNVDQERARAAIRKKLLPIPKSIA